MQGSGWRKEEEEEEEEERSDDVNELLFNTDRVRMQWKAWISASIQIKKTLLKTVR